MKTQKERIRWASQQLSALAVLPGFPKDARALEAYADAFLRIVHNKTIREILEPLCVTASAKEELSEALAKLGGETNDVEWILRKILDECEMVPMPIKIRRMYSRYLPPSTKVDADSQSED